MCRYYDYDWNNWGGKYTCDAVLEDVLEPNVTVTSALGDHSEGKTDLSVLGVEISRQTTHYLVQGLTKLYPLLDHIYIFRSHLTYLTREDFYEYRFVKTISLSRNLIEEVPEDAPKDLVHVEYFSLSFNKLTRFPNVKHLAMVKGLYLFENSIRTLTAADLEHNLRLEELWIYKNQIQYIEPDVFDNLHRLKSVDLRDNPCINLTYEKNTTESFKETVVENCSNYLELSIRFKEISRVQRTQNAHE